MRRAIGLLGLAGLLGVAACDRGDVVGPDPGMYPSIYDNQGTGAIKVMSRNVFVGVDVDAVLAAGSADEIPVIVAQVYPMLFTNDFHDRAAALAREIHETKPDLIGLQEISTIRIQSPGDAVVGGTSPATDVVFDYLDILLKTLADRGESYEVAAVVQNVDIEVPMLAGVSPLRFDDVRLTDFDVILARKGVLVSDVITRNYQAQLSIPFGTFSIDIPRGYAAITAQLGSSRIRFVSTHLEPLSVPELLPLQRAQAAELIAAEAGGPDPLVVVGDLNTEAPYGVTYGDFLGAGFLDAWTLGPRADEPGLTCCHALTLDETEVAFDQRIDFVLLRGSGDLPDANVMQTTITGDDLRERTPAGLWPSDHAGLFTAFRFQTDEN